jgi:hypothetical protein
MAGWGRAILLLKMGFTEYGASSGGIDRSLLEGVESIQKAKVGVRAVLNILWPVFP